MLTSYFEKNGVNQKVNYVNSKLCEYKINRANKNVIISVKILYNKRFPRYPGDNIDLIVGEKKQVKKNGIRKCRYDLDNISKLYGGALS